MNLWDVVIVTASSARQAELYRNELQRRASSGMLPKETQFLVVPDPGDRRVGTGGATINALGVLCKSREWWVSTRSCCFTRGATRAVCRSTRRAASCSVFCLRERGPERQQPCLTKRWRYRRRGQREFPTGC